MDYQILTAETPEALRRQVMAHLMHGYVCAGGVSVTKWIVPSGQANNWYVQSEYAQAMVKEEK